MFPFVFAFFVGLLGYGVSQPDTMVDPVCSAKAEEVAAATTRAQDSIAYQMDFLGKKQDAYAACMANRLK